jgi:DNA-binding LacI/PurR family transcriptional regulator
MNQTVTISKIAALAGVSVGTVSGVLNGNTAHAPKTAARIRALAREMGFNPRRYEGRSAARGMRQFVFLYSAPQLAKHGMLTPLGIAVAQGADEIFASGNDQLIVAQMRSNEAMPICIQKRQVAGVIVRGSDYREDLIERLNGIPSVWTIGSRTPPLEIDAVGVDNVWLGGMIARRILRTDVERVLSIEHEDNFHLELKIRALACEDVLRQNAVVVEKVGMTKLPAAIKKSRRPKTGIFIPGHDAEVLEAYRAIETARLKPRRDIPIFCAATEMECVRRIDERIIAISIDPIGIGRAAARQLLWRLDHMHEAIRTMLICPKEKSGESPATLPEEGIRGS